MALHLILGVLLLAFIGANAWVIARLWVASRPQAREVGIHVRGDSVQALVADPYFLSKAYRP